VQAPISPGNLGEAAAATAAAAPPPVGARLELGKSIAAAAVAAPQSSSAPPVDLDWGRAGARGGRANNRKKRPAETLG